MLTGVPERGAHELEDVEEREGRAARVVQQHVRAAVVLERYVAAAGDDERTSRSMRNVT